MYQKENSEDFMDLDIILTLLDGDLHLRGIARAISVPPSTVMRVLDQLKAKNVIDYKKEGRNKVFFIKKTLQARLYVYMAEHYKFSLLIVKYPKLSVILSELINRTGNRPVILFGSYANFTATAKSDIDIYIAEDTPEGRLKDISSLLSPKFGKLDPNSPLTKEIIKTHVIIYGVEDFYEKTGFFK